MSAAATAAGYLYASGRIRRKNELMRHVEPGAGRVAESPSRTTAPAARQLGSTEVITGYASDVGPWRATVTW